MEKIHDCNSVLHDGACLCEGIHSFCPRWLAMHGETSSDKGTHSRSSKGENSSDSDPNSVRGHIGIGSCCLLSSHVLRTDVDLAYG